MVTLREQPLAVGLLATILIVPILVLTGLMLATHDARTPPPAITGLTATDASYKRYGQIDLAWSPSDARDFAYYLIYASETEITDVTDLSPIGQINDRADVTYQATSYRVPGLRLALFAFLEDTEYWFAVTAVDLAGNESKVSTSASATIEKMPPPPPEPTVFITILWSGPALEPGVVVFEPATVTVPVGTTVGWINVHFTEIASGGCILFFEHHAIASDTGLFYGDLPEGNSLFTYTFTEAGVFGYHCELHPWMTGTVIVE